MFKEYRLGSELNDLANVLDEFNKDFPGLDWREEEILRFNENLLPDLVEGIHSWTIRYTPNAAKFPLSKLSERNMLYACLPDEEGNWLDVGTVRIPRMVIGNIRDWPENHEAIFGSGWESKEHMVEGMSNIYEPIYGKRLGNDDLLRAYALNDFKLHEEYKEFYKETFGK